MAIHLMVKHDDLAGLNAIPELIAGEADGEKLGASKGAVLCLA